VSVLLLTTRTGGGPRRKGYMGKALLRVIAFFSDCGYGGGKGQIRGGKCHTLKIGF